MAVRFPDARGANPSECGLRPTGKCGDMRPDSDLAWMRTAVRALLEAGWTEGVAASGDRFSYTRPAPRYPEQFFWDSCFHAVAWSRLDPARARAELRSLVAAQRPDGLIGHTIFWHRPVRLARAHIYTVLS